MSDTAAQRALAWIERSGNSVPDPAILILGLCAAVIVLSQVLDWMVCGCCSAS